MPSARLALIPFCLGVALLAACDNKAKNEQSLLTTENTDLRAQLDERNKALETSENERRNLALRVAELERQSQSQSPPAAGASTPTTGGGASGNTGFENIDGADVTVKGGTVTVAMEGDVLFDSGKATLKAGAKKSLDKIASVLNSKYGGRRIAVEGHTDTDPIKKSGFKNNFELGYARAYAVREYLISKGVPGDKINVASWGPNDPRPTKAQSRRVEVVVDTK
ncbi:MAG: OmpA family protein [Phycisphaerales bacterium]|jgi:flagellar motor protein MotB